MLSWHSNSRREKKKMESVMASRQNCMGDVLDGKRLKLGGVGKE
jgi:hypothetical protein